MFGFGFHLHDAITLEMVILYIIWRKSEIKDTSIGSRARSTFNVSSLRQRSESSGVFRALANDCGAKVALPRAVSALKSLRATVTNDMRVFASCKRRSGSSVRRPVAGLSRVESF